MRADGRPAGALLAALLIGTFACAYATDILRCMPCSARSCSAPACRATIACSHALIERIEYVAILVLMPVFFALAGLNTTPDAFGGAGLGALALILAAAIVGKIAGGAAGARIAGQPWRDVASRSAR